MIHEGSGQVLKEYEWMDVPRGSVVFVPGNEEPQIRNNPDNDLIFTGPIPKGAPEP